MRCVIAGGGQAAVSAAARLRELDDSIAIRLISAETVLPYQRPPLSKTYLSGEMPLDRLLLRPPDWYEEQRIDVTLGDPAVRIDRDARSIQLKGGDVAKYDRLLLAIGTRPRRWPDDLGAKLSGVFTLRETLDSDAIRPFLKAGNRLVVIGGGYIGLEAAAVARKMGLEVTVVEAAERILQRVAAPETSDYFRSLHDASGVAILESARPIQIVGERDAVVGVLLADGAHLPADLVLVGIGVEPNIELAQAAGLETGNGIVVDGSCRTADPNIFAAGDCAAFPFRGEMNRLESVPHAIHQAETAAANMLGHDLAYEATPWFWSDQYHVKLQIAGLNTGYDHVVVRPGRREGAQSVWYFKGESLLAVDAMNDAPSFMTGRRLVEAGRTVPRSVVADPSSNLKEWV